MNKRKNYDGSLVDATPLLVILLLPNYSFLRSPSVGYNPQDD